MKNSLIIGFMREKYEIFLMAAAGLSVTAFSSASMAATVNHDVKVGKAITISDDVKQQREVVIQSLGEAITSNQITIKLPRGTSSELTQAASALHDFVIEGRYHEALRTPALLDNHDCAEVIYDYSSVRLLHDAKGEVPEAENIFKVCDGFKSKNSFASAISENIFVGIKEGTFLYLSVNNPSPTIPLKFDLYEGDINELDQVESFKKVYTYPPVSNVNGFETSHLNDEGKGWSKIQISKLETGELWADTYEKCTLPSELSYATPSIGIVHPCSRD